MEKPRLFFDVVLYIHFFIPHTKAMTDYIAVLEARTVMEGIGLPEEQSCLPGA